MYLCPSVTQLLEEMSAFLVTVLHEPQTVASDRLLWLPVLTLMAIVCTPSSDQVNVPKPALAVVSLMAEVRVPVELYGAEYLASLRS